jgi:FG-GAP-like repeat/CHAP domain
MTAASPVRKMTCAGADMVWSMVGLRPDQSRLEEASCVMRMRWLRVAGAHHEGTLMKTARYRVTRRRSVFFLLLLALLLSGLTAVGARPASAGTSAPSWWHGTTCDTYNYPGSYALGASFDGVQACGPGPTQGGTDHLVNFGVGTGEYEWECVELSMRYMYLVYGIAPYYLPNGAQDIVSAYSGSVLKKVSNASGSGVVPSPGDILAFAASATHPVSGHTAVVTAVSVDSSGNGTVTYMQQNASANGWGSVQVTDYLLGDSITGWLHNPNGNPQPPPSISQAAQSTTMQGDFNGDGHTDIAVFYNYPDEQTGLWVFWGNGSGGFSGPTLAWESGTNAWDATAIKAVVADFNGDGRADIAVFYNYGNATTALFMFYSQGTTFSSPVEVWGSGTGNWDWNAMQAVAGDFTGSGKADIAVMYTYPGNLTTIAVLRFSQ